MEYELFLHSARAPALRPAALRWATHLARLVRRWTDDPAAQRRVCAYVDGLLLQSLVAGSIPGSEVIEADLRALVQP